MWWHMAYNPSTQEVRRKDVEVGLFLKLKCWGLAQPSNSVGFCVKRLSPGAFCTLGMHSTAELYPSPVVWKG